MAVAVALYMVIASMAPLTAYAEGASGGDSRPVLIFQGYSVEIVGAYAVTEVSRIIENPWDESIAHSFVFSIPEEALISNFSIEIDDVTYYAAVLEREDAQDRYDQSVEEGRDAGLVSSRGRNTFAYSVSLSPRETVQSTLRFEQMLLKENGWYRYELPMAGSTGSLKVRALGVDVAITSTAEIDRVRTEGYEEDVNIDGPTGFHASVSMRKEDVAPSEDLVVEWSTQPGPMEGTMLFGERDGAGYFVHVFDPDLEGTRVPKDFVFVLDRSGSMNGRKLEQAKKALAHIYETLDREDRFSFVRFSTNAINWKDKLVKASDDNKRDILEHIRGIDTGGGTNIHSGVIAALDIFKADGDAVPVIVLLTDGRANVGIYDRSEFRKDVAKKNTVDASIFCIAFGGDADWPFLEALALENDGRAKWVIEDGDAKATIVDFTKSFSTPLVADLSFDYGPGVTDVYPTSFPAHYQGSEILLAGRYPLWHDGIDLVVRGRSGEGEIVEHTTISTQGVEMQDFVPRFWAFQRIQHLIGRMKYNGTDNASVAEITELALEFKFVTDYTSLYVELPIEKMESRPALDNDPDYHPSYGGPASADSMESPGFMGFEVLLAFIAIVSIGWAVRRSRR